MENTTQPQTPQRVESSLIAKSNFSFQKIKPFFIGLFSLFIFIGLWRVFFKPGTLTVAGEGKASFTPTEVSMIITRINSGSNAINTIREGDAGISVLINTARSIGGNNVEIEKIFYQVQPGISADRGYQVANGFSLKFNDPSRASEMIKNLYEDGASSVTGVAFSSIEKAMVDQVARKEAVKNAENEAKGIAKSAGKRLGRVVTIVDDGNQAGSSITNEVQTESGLPSVSVTKNVSVIYEMW